MLVERLKDTAVEAAGLEGQGKQLVGVDSLRPVVDSSGDSVEETASHDRKAVVVVVEVFVVVLLFVVVD